MNRRIIRASAVCGMIALGIVCTAIPSEAAYDMFLKIDGIPGSSRDAKHPNEIEIESIQFGMSNASSLPVAGVGGTGKVSFSDITFTKTLDKSSPVLMSHCVTGTHIKSAKLTCRKAGTQDDFYRVDLTDVFVTGYSLSSGGDRPMESISLNFTKVEWERLIQTRDGTMTSAEKGGWDLKLTRPSGSSAPAPGVVGGPNRLPLLGAFANPQFAGAVRSRALISANIFAKATGIDGESTDSKHLREIELSSFSWGMTNPSLAATGGGGGKVKIGDGTQTKGLDKSSVPLMLACATGRRIPEVVITFTKPGTPRLEYLKVKFTNALVSSYQHSGAGGSDMPTESLSLNFTKMEWEYFEQKPDGTMASAGKVGYDLATNKKL